MLIVFTVAPTSSAASLDATISPFAARFPVVRHPQKLPPTYSLIE
jgi:hypothetical protein